MKELHSRVRLPLEGEAHLQHLVRLAVRAQSKAYAPYSQYQVGCVIEDSVGKIHSGCNVENASYSAVLCAERVAVGKMVSRGALQIALVVLVTSSDEPVFPCGVCLQVLGEFGTHSRVIAVGRELNVYRSASLSELYPSAFTKQKLKDGLIHP